MKHLFSDKSTYKPVKATPSIGLQKRTYRLLGTRNTNMSSGDEELPRVILTQTDTSLAKYHSLPKIRDNNFPPRPIISTVGSPTEFASKDRAEILSVDIENLNSHI